MDFKFCHFPHNLQFAPHKSNFKKSRIYGLNKTAIVIFSDFFFEQKVEAWQVHNLHFASFTSLVQ